MYHKSAAMRVNEHDFHTLAAAVRVVELHGDKDTAARVDVMCRRVGMTLANAAARDSLGSSAHLLAWDDVPSLLGKTQAEWEVAGQEIADAQRVPQAPAVELDTLVRAVPVAEQERAPCTELVNVSRLSHVEVATGSYIDVLL